MQKAVIIDIDGTLSQSPHVDAFKKPDGHTDWKAWIESTRYAPVNEWCKELTLSMERTGYRIIFMTARSEANDGINITRQWLDSAFSLDGGIEYELIMRPLEDYRPDINVKLDLYSRKIAPFYDVLFAIDDKKTIIDMWRNLNIAGLHCADY